MSELILGNGVRPEGLRPIFNVEGIASLAREFYMPSKHPDWRIISSQGLTATLSNLPYIHSLTTPDGFEVLTTGSQPFMGLVQIPRGTVPVGPAAIRGGSHHPFLFGVKEDSWQKQLKTLGLNKKALQHAMSAIDGHHWGAFTTKTGVVSSTESNITISTEWSAEPFSLWPYQQSLSLSLNDWSWDITQTITNPNNHYIPETTTMHGYPFVGSYEDFLATKVIAQTPRGDKLLFDGSQYEGEYSIKMPGSNSQSYPIILQSPRMDLQMQFFGHFPLLSFFAPGYNPQTRAVDIRRRMKSNAKRFKHTKNVLGSLGMPTIEYADLLPPTAGEETLANVNNYALCVEATQGQFAEIDLTNPENLLPKGKTAEFLAQYVLLRYTT